MDTAITGTDYVLGSTDAEHERLARQAKTLEPYTARLFRDAGPRSRAAGARHRVRCR